MGKKRKKKKKKRGGSTKNFWCFYCDRKFTDEKVLLQHQRNKHFKCDFCNKRLTSAKGLKTHAFKIHRQQLFAVPNSKIGRDSFKYEIWGMVGIPTHFLKKFKEENEMNEPPQKKRKLQVNRSEPVKVNSPEIRDGNSEVKSHLNISSTGGLKKSNDFGRDPYTPVTTNQKEYFIFKNEEYSMEEFRAQNFKYNIG